MARARNLKPNFFINEDLASCGLDGRLLFAGLWCHADREGRLEDRPTRIKIQILPYDDVDVDVALNKLVVKGFILRYSVEGNKYIQIINFTKHQNPHVKEHSSTIPAPDSSGASTGESGSDPALTLNPLTSSLNPIHTSASPPSAFELAFAEYPKRSGSNPKRDAEKSWKARIRAGVLPEAMLGGARIYKKYCEDEGLIGTSYVMQAKRFFGAGEPFKEEWTPSRKGGSHAKPDNSAPARVRRANNIPPV